MWWWLRTIRAWVYKLDIAGRLCSAVADDEIVKLEI